VVELKPAPSAIDELSKLLISKGDLNSAAEWLKKRLKISEPQELTTTLLRLSRLLIKIGEEKEAVKTLEEAFEGAPKNAEVRKLLFEEYKKLGEQLKLAKALERSAINIKEPKTKLLYAKEAANLFINQLNDYASALTVLKIVNEFEDEDFNYKIMLADSYLAVDEFDEAEILLGKILEEFGRRRTPVRAAVHGKLAGVLRAKGNMDEALENLELASKIDSHNIDISVSLARLAFEKGDLDLAERTYRALLMTVRREKDSSAQIGPSLILLELSWVAEEKEQQEKADELQQSALESLENDNSPIQVIEKRLIEKERFELLEKIYKKEIAKEVRPVIKARIYLKLANIYNTHLDNIDAAFDAGLAAVKEDSGNPVYHDMVERLANELDRFDQYESTIDELLKITRRDDELLTKCELLLRSISIKIKKGENLELAKEQFKLAESLGVREVDVMRTGSVLAGAMGDQSEQVRILEFLSSMGASLSEADTHLDAMFTLSEIYMASEDTFDEGLENLKTAYNESDNIERAGRILRKISSKIKDKEKIVPIFERIARSSKDSLLLLDYFKILAKTEQATPAAVQEGALLAIENEHMEDAYFLMETIVSLSERYPEYVDAISWAMLGLGERKIENQDMAGAVKLFMDAADMAGDENCFQFGLKIAETIAMVNGDLLLASKVYERLLELQPGSNFVWEPLSDIYSKLENIDGFECLVEESLYSIEDVASRNSLRLKWARLLLTLNDRTEDAVDILKNILMDDPGHGEALSELSNYLISSGNTDDLLELLNDRFESSIERESKDEVKSLAVELIKHVEESEMENIYRRALDVTGDDKDLLLGLFKVLDPEEDSAERISILERTLNSETGEDASKLSLKIAEAYREMGDSESVSRTLKKGYELNPQDLELKDALIDDFKNNEDFRGLVTVLNDVALSIEDSQDKKDLLLQVAEIYKTQLNDINGEIKSLVNISAITPDDFTVVNNLIDAFIRADKITDAQERISESLEVFENETERSSLLLHRIKIYKMTGDLDGAIADAEDIFSVNKELIEDELEQLLINQQEFCRTANDVECERAIVYKLASLYKGNDDSDKIVSILSDWLEKNDKDVDAWRELLEIFKKHEDWQMVVAACKKLTILTEGDEQLLIARILTEACKNIGDLETARRGLEYIYKENIDGTSLRTELKSVYEELGAYQELAVFHAHDAQAARDEGERAELFRKAGESYLKAGDPDTALMALNESLALDPDNLDSAILVIDIEIENRNFEGARELIEKAIDACKKKRSPQMAALQLRMATLFEKDGDKIEQLNWLEQASQSDRNDGDIIAQVAYLGLELEQWDTALKALRTISLLKTPCIISKAESFFLQGKISHKQDDDKRAILYVKKAIQENKDYQEAIDFLEEIS
ncbi:MAG: tetratricopeptide repeat protein, partial [Deltaproteobacteria bacterium]|nr:tetratricopeptide repeat protein [Deltaproteobacteria bacterium]